MAATQAVTAADGHQVEVATVVSEVQKMHTHYSNSVKRCTHMPIGNRISQSLNVKQTIPRSDMKLLSTIQIVILFNGFNNT